MTTLETSVAVRSPKETEAMAVDAAAQPRRWVFSGKGSLPSDADAREHEKRGRKWLVVSYVFCPCHTPLVLALLGAVFGGTAFGGALTGNAVRVGAVLTTIYW